MAIDASELAPIQALIIEALTRSPLMLDGSHTPEGAALIAELCFVACEHGGWPLSEMESGSFVIASRLSASFEVIE